jgi:hypothetical protein
MDDLGHRVQYPRRWCLQSHKLQVTQQMVSGSRLISDICMSLPVLPPAVMSWSYSVEFRLIRDTEYGMPASAFCYIALRAHSDFLRSAQQNNRWLLFMCDLQGHGHDHDNQGEYEGTTEGGWPC